jgi:hypothetical protein
VKLAEPRLVWFPEQDWISGRLARELHSLAFTRGRYITWRTLGGSTAFYFMIVFIRHAGFIFQDCGIDYLSDEDGMSTGIYLLNYPGFQVSGRIFQDDG